MTKPPDSLAAALAPLRGARQLPHYMLRWYAVFCRNFLFWRKLAIPSLLGNFGESVLYLLAMGYGLGAFVGEMEGLSYRVFIASGIIASSAMTTASFEAMYSAYTRMTHQATWDAITTTPLTTADVVAGEIAWAAVKGLINASAIAVVALALGGISLLTTLLALPVVLLAGLCFASMAMVVTATARGYEFFLYYTTLAITPMLLLSGVFFPPAPHAGRDSMAVAGVAADACGGGYPPSGHRRSTARERAVASWLYRRGGYAELLRRGAPRNPPPVAVAPVAARLQ